MSYAQLIAEGLVNAPDGMLTLSEIYNAISARHPYYKMEARNWQNSIRHNLTLNKSFTKVPRMSSSEGRGSYWKLEPGAESIIFKRSARNVNKSNTVNNSANTSLNTSSLNLSGVNLVQTSGGMTEVTTANLVSYEFKHVGHFIVIFAVYELVSNFESFFFFLNFQLKKKSDVKEIQITFI